MNSIHLHIMLIALLVSCVATIPGVFLVLRGVALMSDAISHAILLGIVLMFFLVHNLNSPWLIIGASLAGVATVLCTEILIGTQRIKKDAAIGLVFPLFFAVGVILISLYARNVHLDADMVLLGEIAFAPFNRLIINGIDIGPYALWILSAVGFINILFITLFYKELKVATFDPILAQVLGFWPVALYYGLMTITSITAVAAFDIVGSIVVVALIITPASTAYLLTDCLAHLLSMSLIIAATSAVSGYAIACILDVSIAGSIATMTGILFLLTLLCAPEKGIIARFFYIRKRNKIIAQDIICYYLLQRQSGAPIYILTEKLDWQRSFADMVIAQARNRGLLTVSDGCVFLTDNGLRHAREVLNYRS